MKQGYLQLFLYLYKGILTIIRVFTIIQDLNELKYDST